MYVIVAIAMFITAIVTKEVGYLYASGMFAIADSLWDIARFIKNK